MRPQDHETGLTSPDADPSLLGGRAGQGGMTGGWISHRRALSPEKAVLSASLRGTEGAGPNLARRPAEDPSFPRFRRFLSRMKEERIEGRGSASFNPARDDRAGLDHQADTQTPSHQAR